MNRRVVILQETLPEYRVALFEQLRERGAEAGIDVEVVHGRAGGARGDRLNRSDPSPFDVVRNRYLPGPGSNRTLVWQPALRRCLRADLVVVEQANRLLLNQLLVAAQRLGGPKLAFWGHGRNLQGDAGSRAERFKRRTALAPSWWFAYTSGVARYLEGLGYPPDRITTIGNTIDVRGLRREVEQARAAGGANRFRCLFLGGLHPHKRLDLLFAAADLLAAQQPGFELRIAGAGEQRQEVEQFVATRPWADYLGPLHGQGRAHELAAARVLLIPGLVGLVALDAFAAGIPLVTTTGALHSPEVEYLRDGENAVLVREATPQAYAAAAIELLNDADRWHAVSVGAWSSADQHQMEDAAARFVSGLTRALGDEANLHPTGSHR